jgi:hypothetical protein
MRVPFVLSQRLYRFLARMLLEVSLTLEFISQAPQKQFAFPHYSWPPYNSSVHGFHSLSVSLLC